MRRFDLVAFDVDGTLVRGPERRTVWEVLNERFTGTPDHNVERFALYKAGKLSYADWVELDVTGWIEAGATRESIVEAFASLEAVPGTLESLQRLAEAGCKLVVISGTIDVMLHTLLPDAPFDEVYCNHLGFDDTGKISHWRATPFDMQGKAKLLKAVAIRHEIPLARCAFVGDSDNDVWVAQEAGFSIGVHPTDDLAEVADVVLRTDDLREILPHLGL
jgi:HAD superfamily phosphoserine phosphatase-like hydrolase